MVPSRSSTRSVPDTTSFRLLAGWFRFICSNGLIVGTRMLDFRRTHTPWLELSQVEAALDRACRGPVPAL